ncbi:MAG: hypothetical protein ACRETZ_01405 [Steroidobacteraceae bacterium]
MLKKLVPAVLGALLIASPVIAVTTASAAAQATPMKTHHKVVKHKMAAHHTMKHHVVKHHWKAKKKAAKKA